VRWILLLAIVGCAASPAPKPVAAPVAAEPPREADPPRPEREPVPAPPAAAIRAMVKLHAAELSACYEKWSAKDAPRVMFRFTIGSDGRVIRSQATGAQGGFENCIADTYRGFVLDPPPAGTLTVSYPWSFATGGS